MCPISKWNEQNKMEYNNTCWATQNPLICFYTNSKSFEFTFTSNSANFMCEIIWQFQLVGWRMRRRHLQTGAAVALKITQRIWSDGASGRRQSRKPLERLSVILWNLWMSWQVSAWYMQSQISEVCSQRVSWQFQFIFVAPLPINAHTDTGTHSQRFSRWSFATLP